MSGIKEELHLTHGSDARSLCEELDYVDMLALSGLFRQWALYEKRFTPEQRTALIAWSADLEELAQWAGEEWRASEPSLELPVLAFLARWVLRHSRVIKLEHARYWLQGQR